jgi:DNA repair exonuclease SbcCD ATPase subunit
MELRQADNLKNDVERQKSKIDRMKVEKKNLDNSLLQEQRNLKDLNERIETLSKEVPPQGEDATSIHKEIDKLENNVIETREEKEELLTLQSELDFCERMFGPSGIRNLLVRGIIPKLNEQVNRFAEILTDGELTIEFVGEVEVGSGRKTESRNKLDVRVVDRFGSEKYCKESGGEKRRVDICVNLALNYLVASRIGLPFVMFDEFYASLDKRGEMKVMELLEELKKDIPSIFVISNNESISSSDFDNVWTVVREGKESWIEKG